MWEAIEPYQWNSSGNKQKFKNKKQNLRCKENAKPKQTNVMVNDLSSTTQEKKSLRLRSLRDSRCSRDN